MKHRRAQIDDAIIETFKPLEVWNPQIAYKTGDRRLYKAEGAAEYSSYEVLPGVTIGRHTGSGLNPAPDSERGRTQWVKVDAPLPALFGFKTVQKQYTPWTALVEQDAVPTLQLVPGDRGSKPDSPAIGFTDERYPVELMAVLREVRSKTGNIDYSLIDQVSDVHYSVERQFKANHVMGVEGVLQDGTKIEGWRNSEEKLYPVLIIQFRIMIVHRYRSTSSV